MESSSAILWRSWLSGLIVGPLIELAGLLLFGLIWLAVAPADRALVVLVCRVVVVLVCWALVALVCRAVDALAGRVVDVPDAWVGLLAGGAFVVLAGRAIAAPGKKALLAPVGRLLFEPVGSFVTVLLMVKLLSIWEGRPTTRRPIEGV
jgi:hypothetical protein